MGTWGIFMKLLTSALSLPMGSAVGMVVRHPGLHWLTDNSTLVNVRVEVGKNGD